MDMHPLIDIQIDRGSATYQVLQWNDTTKRFVPTLTPSGLTSIGVTGTGTFGQIIDNGLTASLGVYTDGSKQLTSTAPTTGILGYWSRAGTTITTSNAGDDLTLTGNLLLPDDGFIGAVGATQLIKLDGSLDEVTANGKVIIPASNVPELLEIGDTTTTSTDNFQSCMILNRRFNASDASATSRMDGLRVQLIDGSSATGTPFIATVKDLKGMTFTVSKQGSITNTATFGNNVDTMTGMEVLASDAIRSVTSPTPTDIIYLGFDANLSGGPTFNNAAGVYTFTSCGLCLNVSGTPTLTSGTLTADVIGLDVQSIIGNSAGTSTAYGIRLAAPTGADTLWSIYSQGGDMAHLGDVAIGSLTAPSYPLDVTGTIRGSAGRIKTPSRYTTTQTLDGDDYEVFCNTDGGAWTVTLPAGQVETS